MRYQAALQPERPSHEDRVNLIAARRGSRNRVVCLSTRPGASSGTRPEHTTGPLDAGYQRFIERKLREEFGFEGSPIEVSVKPRKKLGPGGRGKAHG